jgi:large subunit ribosomal protein L25
MISLNDMTISLNAEKRTKIGKTDRLRKTGILPAVCYGHTYNSTPIQIKKSDFLKAWKEAGESTVVSINIDNTKIDTLIYEVNTDPITNEPIHADFYVFEKGHKLDVDVPIEFVGVSPAVKELGGILVKVMHEIKIKADPSNLPHKIEVDISSLVDFDSQISAGDIILPSGVELEQDKEEVVAAIAKQEEEKEEIPVDLSQIEVEKKGKKEEEPIVEETK